MAGKKGGSSGGNEAAIARMQEQERQDRVRGGTAEINRIFGDQFTDDFYKKRTDAFIDYSKPQLDDQFGDARKQLTYALARSGNLESSTRAEKEADLQKEYDNNDRAITDKAVAYGNETRNNVEAARADLIKMLNTSGDASGAANSAISRASTLSAPDAFSPLGPMFSNFSAALAQQAALERGAAYSGGAIKPTYNTGLFANTGSVKVT